MLVYDPFSTRISCGRETREAVGQSTDKLVMRDAVSGVSSGVCIPCGGWADFSQFLNSLAQAAKLLLGGSLVYNA